MNSRYFCIFITTLVFVVSSTTYATERQSCHLCGMYIDQYLHTAASLIDKENATTATCGVADMLRFIEDSGGPDAFTSIQVVDWNTQQKITASSATYVIGSDIIPDMLPNIIAFRSEDDAEQFITEHGGAAMSFTQALLSISPMGMTMPMRINTAVVPPQGAAGVGAGYMYMNMDDLMIGSDSVSFADFRTQTGRAMAPQEMISEGEMYMAGYALSDNLATTIKTSYLKKEMSMQMFMMGKTSNTTIKNSGMADTSVTLRYNLWKDSYYSKFFSLLGGVSLPTGDFDNTLRDTPGLQLGLGTVGYNAGLLASARYGDFWFHSELSYFFNPENSDDYDFGDVTKIGLAAHYTPNPNFMIGLETDYTDTDKHQNRGVDVNNSGGKRANLAIISSWRFLTALGGNFNLKVTAGIPYYEDVNAFGLGGDYFANAMLSFSRRIQNNF